MNRILEEPVAILGGGACGHTFAADLILGLEYWAPFADVILPPMVGPLSKTDILLRIYQLVVMCVINLPKNSI